MQNSQDGPSAKRLNHGVQEQTVQLDAAPNAMLMIDERGRIVLANTQTTSLFGYTEAELTGKQIELLIPECFRDHHHNWSGFLSQPSTLAMGEGGDLYGRRKDGSEVLIEIGLNPIRTDDGAFVLASVIEITERKKMEVALAQLAAIVESSDDAIIGKSVDGIITTWNAGAERLFGYSREEALGRSIRILIPAERWQEEDMILNKIVNGEPVDHFETERCRKDGRPLHVSVTISPIKDKEGRIIGASKIARDITESKRAREAILQMNEILEQRVAECTAQLQAANKELEAFSYSVSHDLRAPLRHINGFSQALMEDYEERLDSVGKGYLQQVRGASREMAELIDGLLLLSRVTRSEMRREPIDLSELALSAVTDLQRAEPHREVAIKIEPGLSAQGDKRLLRVVLVNLIGNAWKFTNHQARPEIAFGALRENDAETVYFVRDNGAGFDMAYANKLFGAFQRLHRTGEFAGSGIGLATVQRIILRHGGRAWAEGAINQGAVFYFTIPHYRGNSNGKREAGGVVAQTATPNPRG